MAVRATPAARRRGGAKSPAFARKFREQPRAWSFFAAQPGEALMIDVILKRFETPDEIRHFVRAVARR